MKEFKKLGGQHGRIAQAIRQNKRQGPCKGVVGQDAGVQKAAQQRLLSCLIPRFRPATQPHRQVTNK